MRAAEDVPAVRPAAAPSGRPELERATRRPRIRASARGFALAFGFGNGLFPDT